MVRSVTHREPEFNARDVVLFLALRAYEADMGSHGHPMSEATDPANQFAFKASMHTDWAAKAIADADETMRKQYPDGNHNGHVWGVTRLSVPAKQEPDGADH